VSDGSTAASRVARVAIVGGGIAGLATAFALHQRAAQANVQLTTSVFEADTSWGGKILTHRAGDFLIEAGPDSFLSQKPWALELCGALGLSHQLVNTNEANKKTFVFSRGRLRELPEGLVLIVPTRLGPFLRSGLLSWTGLARMGLDLVMPARRVGDDESLAGFFRRRLGREAFERLVEPLMAGIYAGDAEQMSLQATFPRFVELERQHGSLIRGMLSGRKRSGSSGTGPARPTRTMFVTLQGGLGELVHTLVERLAQGGTKLNLGRPVQALRVRSSRIGTWTYDLLFADGEPFSADAVVLATPAFTAAELLRPLSPTAAGLLETIPYASTATVSLAYKTATLDRPPTGFGFVVPRVEQRDLIAATWSSSKWPNRAPASHALIRGYLGGTGREQVLNLPDADLVRRIRDELTDIIGLRAEPELVELRRWPRAMPQYTLGHLERLKGIQDSLAAYPGLALVGAGYRGIGIPDCIRDGTDAAVELLAYLLGQREPRRRTGSAS
jgi:oxygen-dependent protoporphyrinogen oxidase